MISSRWMAEEGLAGAISPPFVRRELANASLHLAGIPHVDRRQFHTKRRRYRLDCGKLSDPGGGLNRSTQHLS
jgi:hypothetical protein